MFSVLVERRSRRPRVLAHRDADVRGADPDAASGQPRHEVPLLVEDPVVRQLHLVVASLDVPAAQERRGVVEPCVAPVNESGDHAAPAGRPPRQLPQRLQVVVDERLPKHKILRRVASDRELREADQVGPRLRGPARPGRHGVDVPLEITDRRVDLTECDANHGESVARSARW
jgi:hypothetical protein